MPIRYDVSESAVVAFLRAEADMARHAQANAEIGHPDKLYRMGEKDGLLLAALAIENGIMRHAQGMAPEGRGREGGPGSSELPSPVAESDAPKGSA